MSLLKAHCTAQDYWDLPEGVRAELIDGNLWDLASPSRKHQRVVMGAPDLVVEVVSPSNPEMDYVSKLGLYREAGVREYWICDPQKERTLVYGFGTEGVMSLYPFDEPVPSSVLPGLSIDFARIVAEM